MPRGGRPSAPPGRRPSPRAASAGSRRAGPARRPRRGDRGPGRPAGGRARAAARGARARPARRCARRGGRGRRDGGWAGRGPRPSWRRRGWRRSRAGGWRGLSWRPKLRAGGPDANRACKEKPRAPSAPGAWSIDLLRLAAHRGSGLGGLLSEPEVEDVVEDPREQEADDEGAVADARIGVGYRAVVDDPVVGEQSDGDHQADSHRDDALPAVVLGVVEDALVAVVASAQPVVD